MVYFASFADYNFCLRGCNAGSLDPQNTEGMFNSAFVACFNWPSWTTQGINSGDSSWSKYIFQCQSPTVNTGNTGTTNASATNNFIRYQGRPFGCNLAVGGTGITSVRFLSPFTTLSSTGTLNGYQNVGMSSKTNFVRCEASVTYSYSFGSWRVGSPLGPVAATVNKTSFFYNSTYGNVNFKDIGILYAMAGI